LSRNGFDIPIIFVTAYPDDSIKARALSAGAVCYLQKPLELLVRFNDCLHAAFSRGGRPAPAVS